MADPTDWHKQETYKGLITISVETLKALLIVNGGAAIAVLTYMGHLNGPSPVATDRALWAVGAYGGGLAVALSAFVISYCAQLRLYGETTGFYRKECHGLLVKAGIILALISIGCFIAGGIFAAGAPSTHQDIAACRVEAYKTFPTKVDEKQSEAINAYIQNCMEAEGFTYNISHPDCPASLNQDAAYFEQCYDRPKFRP